MSWPQLNSIYHRWHDIDGNEINIGDWVKVLIGESGIRDHPHIIIFQVEKIESSKHATETYMVIGDGQRCWDRMCERITMEDARDLLRYMSPL